MSWVLRFRPRRWQLEAYQAWRRSRAGIVSVVTGGGKTAFALLVMSKLRHNDQHLHFTVLVPTVALLDQWYVDLQEDLGVPPEHIAVYSAREKPERPGIINLMVLNTARSAAPRIAASIPSLLIADECHRAGTPSNARALSGPYKGALGLSATPEREYDTGTEQYLRPVLGSTVYRYSYHEALRDKVVSPFRLINVEVPLTQGEKGAYERLSRRIAIEASRVASGKSDDAKLVRLLQARARVANEAVYRLPVAVKLAERHRGERVVVFHESVSAANHIYETLRERGMAVTIYHSLIGSIVRRDNLRMFRRGVYDILVCCRALDEGMNVPEANVAVIASATASKRQRVQRLGRVLRLVPGKHMSTVYTLFATEQERERLVDEAAATSGRVPVKWSRLAR